MVFLQRSRKKVDETASIDFKWVQLEEATHAEKIPDPLFERDLCSISLMTLAQIKSRNVSFKVILLRYIRSSCEWSTDNRKREFFIILSCNKQVLCQVSGIILGYYSLFSLPSCQLLTIISPSVKIWRKR